MIPLKEAAERFSYSTSQLCRLCREGKVLAKFVGIWLVDTDSMHAYARNPPKPGPKGPHKERIP